MTLTDALKCYVSACVCVCVCEYGWGPLWMPIRKGAWSLCVFVCTCLLWMLQLWVCQGVFKCGCLCWRPSVSPVCVCVCVWGPLCMPVRRWSCVFVCVSYVWVCCVDHLSEFALAVPSVDASARTLCECCVCECMSVCVCVWVPRYMLIRKIQWAFVCFCCVCVCLGYHLFDFPESCQVWMFLPQT